MKFLANFHKTCMLLIFGLCLCCCFANCDRAITFCERLMVGVGESSRTLLFVNWWGEYRFTAWCRVSCQLRLIQRKGPDDKPHLYYAAKCALPLSLSLRTANCREMRIWAASIRTTPRACSPFTRLNCAHPLSHISSPIHHMLRMRAKGWWGIYFCIFCWHSQSVL